MGAELAAAAFAFVAVAAAVYGITWRPRSGAIEQRWARLAAQKTPTAIDGEAPPPGLFRHSVSSMGPLRQLLSGTSLSGGTALSLNRAGLKLKVSEYLMIRILTAIILGILVFVLLRPASAGLVFVLIAGVIGYFLPAFYVRMKTQTRQKLISKQLAEALQLISNAMRAGVAFQQAVKLATTQLSSPISDEFEQFLQDTSLGSPAEVALTAMAERSGSADMDLVATTIIVQRTAGGRLSEVLDRIAETMHERDRLRGQIHAMTGQQRLMGNIMSVYPFLLGFLFFLISPSLMSVLWEEELGRVLLAIAVGLQGIGIFIMRQILKLEV